MSSLSGSPTSSRYSQPLPRGRLEGLTKLLARARASLSSPRNTCRSLVANVMDRSGVDGMQAKSKVELIDGDGHALHCVRYVRLKEAGLRCCAQVGKDDGDVGRPDTWRAFPSGRCRLEEFDDPADHERPVRVSVRKAGGIRENYSKPKRA